MGAPHVFCNVCWNTSATFWNGAPPVQLVGAVEQIDVGAQVRQVLIVAAGRGAAGDREGGLLFGRVRAPEGDVDGVTGDAVRRGAAVVAVVGRHTDRRVRGPRHLADSGPAL